MANVVEILLDRENRDPIVLTDSYGRVVSFEQVAVIPYGEKLYCVLKPLDKIEEIADDEAVAFCVNDEGEEPVLVVVTDEKTVLEIFAEYYRLLEEDLNNGGRD